jgi:lysophospholipase L1-like esterase
MVLLRRLAIVAFTALTVIVLVDVVLTATMSSHNDYLTATPNSGFVWKMNDRLIPGINGTSSVRFNSIGARSSELKKNDARIKIVAIGGSTTACFALNQEKTWTNLLEKKLGANFWVGNFGRPGNNSGHHVLQTQFILNKKELEHTKYVILLIGLNDLCGYLDNSSKYLSDYSNLNYRLAAFEHLPNKNLPWLRTRFLFKTMKNVKRKIGFLISAGTFPEAIQKAREKRFTSKKTKTLPDLTLGISKYQKRLSQIIQNCKEHGVQPIFFCQIVMWSDRLSSELEKLLSIL